MQITSLRDSDIHIQELKMLDLHYIPTPNGQKIAILLEDLKLEYRVIQYDMFAGDHLTSDFGRLNPNHKLPVIVDNEPGGGGAPLPVFESGAILLYLAEKYGRFLPRDPRRRSMAQQWLFWQTSALGPMVGQLSHFLRYAPPGNDYGIDRYMAETRRLLTVINHRVSEAEYLARNIRLPTPPVIPSCPLCS
jgi:GST-like protein